jgi:hypothetical protein
MAEVLSVGIANIEATPQVKNDPWEGNNVLKVAHGVVAAAVDQADNDILRHCRVPSNARISSMKLNAADATTTGAIDIGLYNSNVGDDGAVVDRDLFTSALDLTGGPMVDLEVAFESGEYTFAESEKPLWEVLGLSADPHKWYDVVSTVETVFDGGPNIKLEVFYTQ